MSIISVTNLSKAYRIGKKADRADSFVGMLQDSVTAPFRNWRRMRQPTGENREDTDELHWALRDVSFEVKEGEVLGVIGRNGAGKSTLLKILSRITEPTSGEVRVRGRVASLLEVGTGFHPELTGRENVYLNGAILGMHRGEINSRFDEIVEFSGVVKFLDTPIKRYSSGMKVRLAFAVAAHLEAEILIIDEVLAVGDAEFQDRCMAKMQNIATGGRTVILVSHNTSAMMHLCKNGVYLLDGKLSCRGSIDDVYRKYLSLATEAAFQADSGFIRRIIVKQKGQELELSFFWSSPFPIGYPNIGFIVHDAFGNPVFGSSPKLSDVSPKGFYASNGEVIVRVSEPRLLNGKYLLSVFFGDGVDDFAEYHKCLSFNVTGMAGIRQHPYPTVVGCAAARCDFEFA